MALRWSQAKEGPKVLKDILLHVDHTPACANRIEAAISLAQRHQARLTGLLVTAHHSDFRQENPERIAEATREEFLRKVSMAGVNGHWKSVDLAHPGIRVEEMVSYYSCFTDLVVIGQFQPGIGDRTIPADLPERVVLGSGRPVLLIPYVGAYSQIGERIMVAWKPGPKSTRALNDALPLLQTARYVHLLSVDSSVDSQAENENLCEHLDRHGVTAQIHKVPQGDLSISDVLLNMVVDEGIDLVVMGAHAQLRRGNPDLGIVGKSFLRHMTVPVLMSH